MKHFDSPRDLLRAEFGSGPNFMTPTIMRVGWIASKGRQVAYELSRGTGFQQEPIYGVSLVAATDDGGTDRLHDLSRMFFDAALAEDFIASLKKSSRVVGFYNTRSLLSPSPVKNRATTSAIGVARSTWASGRSPTRGKTWSSAWRGRPCASSRSCSRATGSTRAVS